MDGAIGDYDTIDSFDQLILALMIPLVKRVGGILAHVVCWYNILQAMEYILSMGHGLSEFKYKSTVESAFPWSNQGGSQSPIMCTCSCNAILEAIKDEGYPIELKHPSCQKGTTQYDTAKISWMTNRTECYHLGMTSKSTQVNWKSMELCQTVYWMQAEEEILFSRAFAICFSK